MMCGRGAEVQRPWRPVRLERIPPPPRTGSRRGARGCARPRRDHPCRRREQPSGTWASAMSVGPSPRVQGADMVLRHGLLHSGTIPAGAGSKAEARRGAGRGRWSTPPPRPGLRARGTVRQRAPGGEARGAIPAGTGIDQGLVLPADRRGPSPQGAESRYPSARWLDGTGAHPRSLGEQTSNRSHAEAFGVHPRASGEQQ